MHRLLFLLPPEVAHRVALRMLHGALAIPGLRGAVRALCRADGPATELFGLRFRNPVGIAAGFDKNAEHVGALGALGFGFVEVGSVTARPAAGNPRPRLFRLRPDRALINRMGLNNQGADAVAARLATLRRDIPLFVNVAKTHDPAIVGHAAVADYCESVARLAPQADVLVLNVSCPNSGDGRTFEDPEALAALLAAVAPKVPAGRPWLVKVSPDLDPSQLDDVVAVATAAGVSGFTATNTTVSREGLRTAGLDAVGKGGLSGAPLLRRSIRTVEHLRSRTELPIVGVGGISSGADARAMLAAGANLVQLYTGFVYGGPRTVRRVCAELGRGINHPS